jgi:glycosyltransferase involved in cell wall biosynthesis
VNWQDRQNPRSGGAEIHLHEVFGRLATRGHEVTLLVSGFDGAEPRLRLDGMDVHRTGGRHTFPLAATRYHRRHLASQPFDIVIEDLNKVPVFAQTWRRGTPTVLLVHHLFGATAFQEASLPVATATWLLERPLAAFYGRLPVQAVSESTADDLVARGFERNHITVIENGVDLDFYSPDPASPRYDEPTILYLGRLQKYKRVDLIIRALAALRDGGATARLIVAGRGHALDELRGLVQQLGLERQVEFAGFVSEERKRELFRRCWLHALTSPKEGWGISNMEAAACGTATVGSDSPGLRDSVRDGETGFLVPHADVAALADRFSRIIQDPALRDRLGRQAREFASRYSWERSAALTEAHLQGVLTRD